MYENAYYDDKLLEEISNYDVPLPSDNYNNLQDIFFYLDRIKTGYRKKNFDYYNFYGMNVPRVTHIIEACINNNGLMNWASTVGKEEVKRVRDESLYIGSKTHEMIEYYLINRKDPEDISYKTPKNYYQKIMTSYNNFKAWVRFINSFKFYIREIVAIETQVVCTLYGGTIDCIMNINGKNYIVDFKTSKSIHYEHIIQACSYLWAVNAGYREDLPHIDGIGIIRVDKEKENTFEDYFLNLDNSFQYNVIDHAITCWSFMLANYYHNLNMQLLFKDSKKYCTLKGLRKEYNYE